jgi:hypothetical protein
MPLEVWIQHSRVDQFLYDWQTVIAGVLAFVAGFGTVVATMIIARKQINASREDAASVIAATRDQTRATTRRASASCGWMRSGWIGSPRCAGRARATAT